MSNPIFETAKPWTKFIFTIFLMLVSFLIFLLLGQLVIGLVYGFDHAGLSELTAISKANIGQLKIAQAFQSVGIFVIPPILAALLFSASAKNYLSTDKRISISSVSLLVLLIISILPLINGLSEINQAMHLPESLSGLETKMQEAEKHAEKLTLLFLTGNSSTLALILNLFIVAVLPAVGEELLFRGVIQRIFTEWSGNIHVGIWIAAFLFSSIHFQFYGFLPRFILGGIFGYLLVWSGSIWLPITAHFINNAGGVLYYHFRDSGENAQKLETIGTKNSGDLLLTVSFILTALILYALYRKGAMQNTDKLSGESGSHSQ
ncbi:MAG: CPBP family intramembrane glutamic endopeptidase [Bacteroidota bacterium]|nr:CPBP family intramembrane glutamic endopeptidase [Bacteroidota bacterium]